MTTTDARPGGVREVIPFWRAVYEIGRKETMSHLRTKRLYVMGGIMLAVFLAFTMFTVFVLDDFLAAFENALAGSSFRLASTNIVLAAYLFMPLIGGATFVQLLAIVFSFDGIVREHEDKTLFLILSKPVSREALVLGKFAGAVVSVGSIVSIVAILGYLLVMAMLAEVAPIGDMLRYLLALGLMLAGVSTVAAMALFGSAITKSTIMSVLFSLLMWLAVFNALSTAARAFAAFSTNVSADAPLVLFAQYLNPANSIGTAVKLVVNWAGAEAAGLEPAFFVLAFRGVALEPGLALVSLLASMAVWLSLTVLVVSRRNFE